ncbi:hypothetical protein N566_18250 [Streptomycetaceae bacterium MP113-05]|nr:hypothetical protein N566_18250 [Streptomycetaceae bacterium MP113-05]
MRLTPDKLTKSLKGVRRFTSLDLALIAEETGTTVDWLLTGRPDSRPAFAARTTDESLPQRERVSAVAERYVAAYDVLKLLRRLPELPPLPEVRSDVPLHVDQGRQLAHEAAASLGADGRPAAVPELETSVLAAVCARALHIDVAVVDLPPGIDGVTWQTNGFRLVLLSPTDVWTRQRFTLAHELGHILAVDAQEPVVEGRIRPGRDRALTEMRANAFAAGLLMPETQVRDRVGEAAAGEGALSQETFARLVVDFKVSPSALAVRLRQLGLVDTATHDRFRQLTAENCHLHVGAAAEYQRQQSWAEARQFPTRVVSQLFRAYEDGETTLRPVAALLGWDVDALHRVLDPAPVQDAAETDEKDPVFTP